MRHRLRAYPAIGGLLLGGALCCCGDGLGECDMDEAVELVYYAPPGSEVAIVATTGQALTHDSCGGGGFCHSGTAKGDNRKGAPGGLDFDMVPKPAGLPRLHDYLDAVWSEVDDGTMPPKGTALWTTGWRYHPTKADAELLPEITTEKGKALFRNWLACDAPVVSDVQLVIAGDTTPEAGAHDAGESPTMPNDPDGGTMADAGPTGPAEPEKPDWADVHGRIIGPICATSGCHDGSTKVAGLALEDECDAYEAMLSEGNVCKDTRVVPGNAEGSFLMDKLSERPSCGSRMPTIAPLPATRIEAIREWIEAGAQAKNCE